MLLYFNLTSKHAQLFEIHFFFFTQTIEISLSPDKVTTVSRSVISLVFFI